MTIGVDAGMLGIADKRLEVGVWRVAVNLLTQLGKIDKKNDYRLYSFAPIPKSFMSSFGSRMENRVLTPSAGYFTLRLPVELTLRPVDAFLALAQAVPKGAPNAVGFCFDVGFLRFPKAYPGSAVRLKRQTKEMVERAAHIIAISETTRRDLTDFYAVSRMRTTVAYPGVDARFTRHGPTHKEKYPYFLFVGARKPSKNVPLALRAFATFLQKAEKPYLFCIVGGNFWEDPAIEQTIGALKLRHHVRIMGHIPDEKLPAMYRGANALVVPSLWEGFCLPAAEAMACGCPVVYTKSGSLPEIVGKAGLGCTPGDVKSFAAALSLIDDDPAVRAGLAKHALLQAKKYNWRLFAKAVLAITNIVKSPQRE